MGEDSVRPGQIEPPQFGQGEPAAILALVAAGNGVSRQLAEQEIQQNPLARIGMAEVVEGGGGEHVHAQFLPDFSHDAGFGGFAGMELAAGKLPFPRQMGTAGTGGQQEAPVPADDCRANFDFDHFSGPRRNSARRFC
jgi:hypothetical protein